MKSKNINSIENCLKKYRLSVDEYHKIYQKLGREPRPIEWALFSALWSEHCSYKSSKIHLKKFAQTKNQFVKTHEGENAGIIDLGEGERIAFKMESHNHPSFIEPFHGAATGVGGILRDIFTMGARPVALANYLCFGELNETKMKNLVKGVVSGIGSYGNCVGVPNLIGQTHFSESYQNNILVNALAIGYFGPQDRIALSAARGPGNWVVYVGAKTGKDGVHGAAMASESFIPGEDDSKKPNIQIGDPFFEKLLIESCLEVIQKNIVVAIQDMGAAGLISSSFEMASKGGVGMVLHLDRVPTRQKDIYPEEILLSESQERMLLVCEPSQFAELEKVFVKWGLEAAVIGEVTERSRMVLRWHDEILTDIDPECLVEGAPVYQRPYSHLDSPFCEETLNQVQDSQSKAAELETENKNLAKKELTQEEINELTQGESKEEIKKKIAPAARIQGHGTGQLQIPLEMETEVFSKHCYHLSKEFYSSKRWIYEQFDQRVGACTVLCSTNSEVGMIRLPSGRGLGVALGCRPDIMKIDNYLGVADAVIWPVLQLASKGIRACAITDCLNFGNPESPQIMSEFAQAVDVIVKASQVFEAPVISGNVSFYNSTEGHNITSTPAIGVVGLRKNCEMIPAEKNINKNIVLFKIGVEGVFSEPTDQGVLDQNQDSEEFIHGQRIWGRIHWQWLKSFQDFLIDLNEEGLLRFSKGINLEGFDLTLGSVISNFQGEFIPVVSSEKKKQMEPFFSFLVGLSSDDVENFLDKVKIRKYLIWQKIGVCQIDHIQKSHNLDGVDKNKNLLKYKNNLGEILGDLEYGI